jgi:uncharacterized protein (TIGR03086 family)
MSHQDVDVTAQELPLFPTDPPDVFLDPEATDRMFTAVFRSLREVIDVPVAFASGPTPCADFTCGALQNHVLGWLQFFAQALNDPVANTQRVDPNTWTFEAAARPGAAAEFVDRSAAMFTTAIKNGVCHQTVVMSQARMAGSGVLGMALGEYLVHGWDLAVSRGQAWPLDRDGLEDAAGPALAFLQTTVAPEYRGPDSGFFGEEVPASPDASRLERLLCFAGRDPGWRPQS